MQSLPSLSMSRYAKLTSENPGGLSCDKLTVLVCILGTSMGGNLYPKPTCKRDSEKNHLKKHALHIKWFGFKLVFKTCCAHTPWQAPYAKKITDVAVTVFLTVANG